MIFDSLSPDTVGHLARRLLGEPNRALSNTRELRFGRRGSLAVNLVRGVFQDHESGASGGVLDLVVYAGQARDRREAARLLQDDGVIAGRDRTPQTPARSFAEAKARIARIAAAGALWKAGKPIQGTTAETYFRRARALCSPLESTALRFLPAAPFTPYAPDHRRHPALIAAVVNAAGRFIGASLTYLRPDGLDKADVSPARKMVGMVGGGRVPLVPGARLIVAEGIESALSAWEVAVALAGVERETLGAVAGLSAGGVAAMAWPTEATSLLIAPDRDASGAGERAAQALAHRAHAAGLSVTFLRPPVGISDWNDHARRAGHA